MEANHSNTIAIFIDLAIAGICLVVFGRNASVLALPGAGILAARLIYWLVKAG